MPTRKKSPIWILLVLVMALSPVLSVWAGVLSANENCSTTCHEKMHDAAAKSDSSSCVQHDSDCETACQNCGTCHLVSMAAPVLSFVNGHGLTSFEPYYTDSLTGNISSGNYRPPRS